MVPNIYMFHRIELSSEQCIPDIYYSRGMVHKISNIYSFIDALLKKGMMFGSIEQCTESNDYFHLSFDDGYKEHLETAYKLKERYCVEPNKVTFSINYGNSYSREYTGMDIVYIASINNDLSKICYFLGIYELEKNIKVIKQKLIQQSPHTLKAIPGIFVDTSKTMSSIFLEKDEIIAISKIFDIACHAVTHRDITFHITDTEMEIQSAKELLEQNLNTEIKTFTYPEGKNNKKVQQLCKSCGFSNALSIRHEENNPFCIGRKIL